MSAAEKTTNEITVEQAVAAAIGALPRFTGQKQENVRVEEVFPPDPETSDWSWSITLSFLQPGAPDPTHPLLHQHLKSVLPMSPPSERVMRVFDVNAGTGEVLRMRRDRR